MKHILSAHGKAVYIHELTAGSYVYKPGPLTDTVSWGGEMHMGPALLEEVSAVMSARGRWVTVQVTPAHMMLWPL